MANIAQTEQQLLQIVHSLYEGNTSYPSASDDDYLVRRDLANKAIMRWDMFKGTLWNELWTPSVGAPGAELVIQANKTSYLLPTDFRFIASYLRLIDSNGQPSFYKKKEPQDIDLYDGQTTNVFYITGSARSGYSLNFLPGSGNATFPRTSDIGKTIKYEYYKRPTLFTTTTDVPEMSNPDYILHYILSYLYRQDDNLDASTIEKGDSQTILDDMQAVNMMVSWREEDRIKDEAFDDNQVSGFGI